MVPWTPCYPLTGGWCGPPGRCVLACGRRVVETSNNDLRYRLKAGGGGRGRVYSGGRDQGYSGGQDRGYGGGVSKKKAVEDAVKQAGGDIRPRQKPRWAKEKEKREKAEAKLEEVTADKEKAKEEIAAMRSGVEKEIATKKRSAEDELSQVKAKVGR